MLDMVLWFTPTLGPYWGLSRALKIWSNRIAYFPKIWSGCFILHVGHEHSLIPSGVPRDINLMLNLHAIFKELWKTFSWPKFSTWIILALFVGQWKSISSVHKKLIVFHCIFSLKNWVVKLVFITLHVTKLGPLKVDKFGPHWGLGPFYTWRLGQFLLRLIAWQFSPFWLEVDFNYTLQ